MNQFNNANEKQQKLSMFESRYYTKKELAKILRLSVKTIDVMMAKKKIEYIKLGAAVRFNGIKLNEQFDK